MDECVDGEYQTFKSRDGKPTCASNFFGAYPELAKRVEDWSDAEIWALNRGGHDPTKVYAAYAEAMRSEGRPTVILAKTVKGYGMGAAGEGQNITHQQKKMTDEALYAFRDRFGLELTDEQIAKKAFYKPAEDSPEMTYLRERREALGGGLPVRRRRAPESLPVPRAVGVQDPARGHRASARSPRRWRSCGSCRRSCATSRSASTSCRSCPTSRAPSAWRACSASSGSSARSASSTGPRTPSS